MNLVAVLGDHPRHPVRLSKSYKAEHCGKENAVPERGTQNFPFLADQTDSRDPDRNVLRGDHFPGDGSRRIGSSQQHRAEMKLVGRCSLQIAEEEVTGGITAAEETRNPT